MALIRAIDHVQVAAPAGCEATARAFYGDLPGLPEPDKPPILAKRGGAWFVVGTQQLHVGVEAEFAPACKAHPALACDDLDALAARLTVAGHSVTWTTQFPPRAISSRPIRGATGSNSCRRAASISRQGGDGLSSDGDRPLRAGW